MIYLDYSATTPVDERVLEMFVEDNKRFFANSNSVHFLGREVKDKIDKSTFDIINLLKLNGFDLVYTSGASESNNLAIKGVALDSIKKKIITSNFEHSSVISCLSYLAKHGFEIEVVDNDEFGLVDLADLENKLDESTCLVSIGAVNSETGIVQNIKKISEVIKSHPGVLFHSDMTQAIGKVKMNFNDCDLISFSAHKFYGLKGVGGLFVRKGISLTPVIHGGKSFSKYRAGTPANPLIYSVLNALKFTVDELDERLGKVNEIHDYLLDRLSGLEDVVLNSNKYSCPQIVNVSFLKLSSRNLQQELSKRGIYVSTTTACASGNEQSLIVAKLTNSEERAKSAVRISLSHLTTKNDIDKLIEAYLEIVKL